MARSLDNSHCSTLRLHFPHTSPRGVCAGIGSIGTIPLPDAGSKWGRWSSWRQNGGDGSARISQTSQGVEGFPLGDFKRTTPQELERLREFWLMWLDRQNWAVALRTGVGCAKLCRSRVWTNRRHFAQGSGAELGSMIFNCSAQTSNARSLIFPVFWEPRELDRLNRWFKTEFVASRRAPRLWRRIAQP